MPARTPRRANLQGWPATAHRHSRRLARTKPTPQATRPESVTRAAQRLLFVCLATAAPCRPARPHACTQASFPPALVSRGAPAPSPVHGGPASPVHSAGARCPLRCRASLSYPARSRFSPCSTLASLLRSTCCCDAPRRPPMPGSATTVRSDSPSGEPNKPQLRVTRRPFASHALRRRCRRGHAPSMPSKVYAKYTQSICKVYEKDILISAGCRWAEPSARPASGKNVD